MLRPSRLETKHRRRGSTLALIAACTIILVVIGVAFIFYTLIMGGGKELQNASDAGVLNVAKVAMIRPGINLDGTAGSGSITLDENSPQGNEKLQFVRCINNSTSGKAAPIALGNINRVWGQVFMMGVNAQAMKFEGSAVMDADGTFKSTKNIDRAYNGALELNNALAKTLNPKENADTLPADLVNAFLETGTKNSLRMMGKGHEAVRSQSSESGVTVAPIQIGEKGNGEVAYRDVGGPSNIYLPDDNELQQIIGEETVFNAFKAMLTDPAVASEHSVNGRTHQYLAGYVPINFGFSKPVYFVPLKPGGKPHLVSMGEFKKALENPVQQTITANAVPNTFLAKGKNQEEKSKQWVEFCAIAQAGPLDNVHQLSIPNGYIRITNWPGFPVWQDNIPHSDPAAGHPGLWVMGNNDNILRGGMHTSEWMNHQLLMARTGYQRLVSPGTIARSDPFVMTMNETISIPNTPSGFPKPSNVDGQNVYTMALTVSSGVTQLAQQNAMYMAGDPNAPADQPDMTQVNWLTVANQADIQNASTTYSATYEEIVKTTKTVVDPKTGDPTTKTTTKVEETTYSGGYGLTELPIFPSAHPEDLNPPQNSQQMRDLNADAIRQLAVNAQLTDVDGIFGSTVHPHNWSIWPPTAEAGRGMDDPVRFMDTGVSQSVDPNDHIWMYTGVLAMPIEGGGYGVTGRYARVGDPAHNPVLWGQAASVLKYLEDLGNVSRSAPGSSNADKIVSRIHQRMCEIRPGTSYSECTTLLDRIRLEMGKDAYIFFDDRTNKWAYTVSLHDRPFFIDKNKSSVEGYPGWLAYQLAYIQHGSGHSEYLWDSQTPPNGGGAVLVNPRHNPNRAVEGRAVPNLTCFYGSAHPIVTNPTASDSRDYISNVRGDWGFPEPYANADNKGGAEMVQIYMYNKFSFKPATGYKGLLGVLELRSFCSNGNNGNCDAQFQYSLSSLTDSVQTGQISGLFSGNGQQAQPQTVTVNNYTFKFTPEDCTCVTFPPGSRPEVPPIISPAPAPTPNGWNQGTNQTDKHLPNCSHTGAC